MSPERVEELARKACSSNPIGKDGDYIMEPAELAKFAALIRAEALEEAPLRQLLVWRMCSDPWPGGDMAAIDDWLNSESRAAGFSDWIDAYHRL